MLKFNSKSLIINDLDPSLKEHLEKIAESTHHPILRGIVNREIEAPTPTLKIGKSRGSITIIFGLGREEGRDDQGEIGEM